MNTKIAQLAAAAKKVWGLESEFFAQYEVEDNLEKAAAFVENNELLLKHGFLDEAETLRELVETYGALGAQDLLATNPNF